MNTQIIENNVEGHNDKNQQPRFSNRNYHKFAGFRSDNRLYILDKEYIKYMNNGYGSIYLQCHKDYDYENRLEEFQQEVIEYDELLTFVKQYNYMITSCQDMRYVELIKLGGHYL